MTKQPSYRFAGYNECWEEKKLGEVVKRSSNSIENPYLPVVEYEDIISGEGRLNKDIFQKVSNKKGLYFSEGDVLFGKLRPYLKNWLLPKFTGIAVGDWWVLQSSELDGKFLYTYIQTKEYQTVANLSTGTKMPRSDWNIVSESFLRFPTLLEQTAIGSFFQDIDQLISLQQRKLEVLKEQKKTYLKLLFPAKGQTKPALRFAGFEDEWKEVKVSDIFRVTRGQVLATTEISEEKTDTYKYPVYSSQTKNEGLLGYYDKYLFETAITWTTDGANAGTVNYREGKFYSTNVNGVLLSDEGFANKVIAEILNNEAWRYVSKVGNPKLMNNVMSEISLVIPNDFREISTLSTLFQEIDKAIAKQEEKVNQLKESKQTLLRKMFI